MSTNANRSFNTSHVGQSLEERLPKRNDHIPLISFVYHYQSFLISHEQSLKEVLFVAIIFYELGALMPVPPRVRGSQIRHANPR